MEPVDPARHVPLATTVARNTVLNSLRFTIVFAAGLATSVLVARALGPHDFGVYRLAMGLIWGLEVLSVLAFPNAVTRFVAEGGGGDRARFTGVVGFYLAQTLVIYGLAVIPLVLFRGELAAFYREDALATLLVLGALGVLPGVLAGVLAAGLRGRHRFRELNRLALVQSLAGVGATALVFALGYRVRGLFVLLITLNVLALVLTWASARRELAPGAMVAGIGRELSARLWNYGLAMGVVALLGAVVWERSEIFFLGRWSSAAEVGFYSLAYTLALQARRIIPTSFGEVLFPVISRLEGLRDDWGIANAAMESMRYLAIVAFPMMIGGFVFAAPVIRALFGAAYLPAAPILALLLVATGVVSLAQPAAAVIVNKERYRFLLWSSALFTAANLALDVLLIPAWQAMGAALANSAVQIAASVVQMIFVARLLRAPLPIGNLARCLGAALIALAPALALRAGGLAQGPVGVVAMAATFVAAYPVLLAVFGVLGPTDFERLHAFVGGLPEPFRTLAGRGVSGVRSWTR